MKGINRCFIILGILVVMFLLKITIEADNQRTQFRIQELQQDIEKLNNLEDMLNHLDTKMRYWDGHIAAYEMKTFDFTKETRSEKAHSNTNTTESNNADN